jgi:hypothetical protein
MVSAIDPLILSRWRMSESVSLEIFDVIVKVIELPWDPLCHIFSECLSCSGRIVSGILFGWRWDKVFNVLNVFRNVQRFQMAWYLFEWSQFWECWLTVASEDRKTPKWHRNFEVENAMGSTFTWFSEALFVSGNLPGSGTAFISSGNVIAV